MSGTGRVVVVYGGTVPNTGKAARAVQVDPDGGGKRLLFFIPIGFDPPVGAAISWGPHHAQFAGQRVAKLSNEIDPNAPLT